MYSCIPPEKRLGGGFEYSYMDGTSMASPHVAGVAALLMAAHPNATVFDIATVLKATARHPGGDHNRPDNRWAVRHDSTARSTQRTVILRRRNESCREPLAGSKLSKEFVARLASIPAHETLHAVVLLETSERV